MQRPDVSLFPKKIMMTLPFGDDLPHVFNDIRYERNDDRNAQSIIVISPEVMNKQAPLRELQTQKKKIAIADVKNQNDLKRRNCNNLSTSPVKR